MKRRGVAGGLMVLATASVIILAAPWGAARAEPAGGSRASTVVVEDFVAELARRLTARLARYEVPGAAIAIVRDGRVAWVGGYGVAGPETKEPVIAETVFPAGSIAKSLTAWGVMVLVERGDVDLDAPVEHYLRRWESPPSPYPSEEVTVARLLSHTAGLPFSIDDLPSSSDEVPVGQLDGALFGVEHEPGARFLYSNPGYVVLGLLIEEVSGRDFAEFMQVQVLDPLGCRARASRSMTA